MGYGSWVIGYRMPRTYNLLPMTYYLSLRYALHLLPPNSLLLSAQRLQLNIISTTKLSTTPGAKKHPRDFSRPALSALPPLAHQGYERLFQ